MKPNKTNILLYNCSAGLTHKPTKPWLRASRFKGPPKVYDKKIDLTFLKKYKRKRNEYYDVMCLCIKNKWSIQTILHACLFDCFGRLLDENSHQSRWFTSAFKISQNSQSLTIDGRCLVSLTPLQSIQNYTGLLLIVFLTIPHRIRYVKLWIMTMW